MVIAVIDNGVEYRNKDLAKNYVSIMDRDLLGFSISSIIWVVAEWTGIAYRLEQEILVAWFSLSIDDELTWFDSSFQWSKEIINMEHYCILKTDFKLLSYSVH